MSLKSLSRLRVIKLGGSLLDLPDLAGHYNRWLAKQPEAINLIIVGGGQLVEAMRELDRCHAFDAEVMHWWCVDLLTQTAKIAALLLPGVSLVDTQAMLRAVRHKAESPPSPPMHAIVLPGLFYSQTTIREHQLLRRLPKDWSTTTDSIAGAFSILIQADELVLLKSVSAAPNEQDFDQWSQEGLVDRAFPLLSPHLPSVRLVNLRTAF